MSMRVVASPAELEVGLAHSPAAQALAEGGPLARVLGDRFRPRPGQQRMAYAVEQALKEGRHLIVEAGTGIGKTFAYLVPVLLSRKRVFISTATRALQDQLFKEDLPLVCRALRREPKVALLKGRANYLCHYRFERTLTKGARSREEGLVLGDLDAWRRQDETGDLAECDFLPEDWRLRPRITSTAENCLGMQCPHFDACFVRKARQRAREAEIIVINHHLLLADFRLREGDFGELLPTPEAVIVDEAHAFGEVAFQAFGEQLSSFQVAALLEDLRDETDLAAEAPLRQALADPVANLEAAFSHARERFAKLADEQGARERLDEPVREDLQSLTEALKCLHGVLSELSAAKPELARLAKRAEELATRTEEWLDGEQRAMDETSPQPRQGAQRCAWYQRSQGGFRLCSVPLDVAKPLADWREVLQVPWVFTSATLAVEGSFEHLQREWGLAGASTLRIESPFDYQSHARLYVPRDFPNPNRKEEHRQQLLALAMRLLHASQGRAFLLFTSHEALQWFAKALRQEQQRGAFPWPLLVQGDRPHHQLLDAFRETPGAVLLGTASFWEGVDVPGQALSLVIIDKLPFASPNDPLREARARAFEASGGDPFLELDLPEAVMALKQGAGRLIRGEDDRGVLVIADPRLLTANYGARFLNSLPPMERAHDEAEVLQFLRAIL